MSALWLWCITFHHACFDIRNSWNNWYCGINHHYWGHWWPSCHLLWVNCHSVKVGIWPRSPKPAVTVLPHCLQACMDIWTPELLNIVEMIIIIGAADDLAPSIITPSKVGGPFILYPFMSLYLFISDGTSHCWMWYLSIRLWYFIPYVTICCFLRFETNEGPIVRPTKAYCWTK